MSGSKIAGGGLSLRRQTKRLLRLVFAITVLTFLGVFSYATFDYDIYVGHSGFMGENIRDFETVHSSYKYSSAKYPTRWENSSDGYLVWSPSCRIPDVDPWDESVRPLIRREPPIVCSDLPPLTRVDNGTLTVDREHARLYAGHRQIWCCYQEIVRWNGRGAANPDDSFSVGECVSFDLLVPLTLSAHQFIFVKCFVSVLWLFKKEVYSNAHAVISMRKDVEQKIRRNVAPTRTRLSVLILGIDSVSRLNAIRAMPETVNYLEDGGWINLRGYNKIGDNTFPNVMAVLTGLDPDQVKNTCMMSNAHPLDSCPFVWKDFAEQGYVTACAEDEPGMGTFNLQKVGFFQTPVDYYMRPFVLALDKTTDVTRKYEMNVCWGPTPATEYIYKYAADFALTFRDHPSFGLFWMNSQSHNNVNSVSALDSRTRAFLEQLAAGGVLNDTLVLLMSDHGMRFGRIRETYVGWLEDRLPMVYAWVPRRFRAAEPRAFANLLGNRDRLTSPYDLHLTLRQLAGGRPAGGAAACAGCVSLLDEVPRDRACGDAGITPDWCTCSAHRPVAAGGGAARAAAEFAAGEINALLAGRAACAGLRVGRVLAARSRAGREAGHQEYVVSFETMPGRALFEATVGYSGRYELIGTVNRINAYGSQSECMRDAVLKKYCFCVT